MSVLQVKRGSTNSWNMGKELNNFSAQNVNGRDSIISCNGIKLKMNIFTSSAEAFPDAAPNVPNSSSKHYGLFIIDKNEIMLNESDSYRVAMKMSSDASSGYSFQLYGVDESGATSPIDNLTPSNTSKVITIEANQYRTIVAFVLWDELRDVPEVLDISLSIKNLNEKETLQPGQLGLEYTEGGSVKLKAGKPGISKWDELPYIGNECLPKTTAEDDGKLLQIVNGNPSWVSFSYIEEGMESIKSDLDEINRNYTQILDKIFTNFDYYDYVGKYVSLNHTSPCVLHLNQNYLVKIDNDSYTVTSKELNGKVSLLQDGIFHIIYHPQPDSANYGFVLELFALPSGSCHLQIFGEATLKEWQSNIENSLMSIENSLMSIENSLMSIDEALDRIIEIQEELMGTTLIAFTIADGEYQAEQGMTWDVWLDSEYNIDNTFSRMRPVNSDTYCVNTPNGMTVKTPDGVAVSLNDTIVTGTAYIAEWDE